MPQQIVELIPSSTAVTPGRTFTVEVIYSSGPEGDRNSEAPGLNHLLHYDSSELNLLSIAPGFEFGFDPIEPAESTEANAAADDGVEATDRVFATSIIDLQSSFPGSENDPGILYTIEFEATDSFDGSELVNRFLGDPPLGFDAPSADNLTLEVNEAPTVANPITDIAVDEDDTIPPVGLFNVFDDDADADADLTYTVTNNSNDSLVTTAIDSTTGELSFTLVQDAFGTADITVQAEDTSGAPSTDDFTITVNPVNDPPEFTSSDAVNVDENLTFVTTVTAEDPDPEDDAITFALFGGADSSLFTIDDNAGELTFNNAPDFENPLDANADNVYEVQVEATDEFGETSTQDLSISVTLPNDPPTFVTEAPEFSVDAEPDLGAEVGQVQATDPEGDDLTFEFTAGNDDTDGDGNPAFAIDNDGIITVNDADDLADGDVFDGLIVAVNDGFNDPVTTGVTVSVSAVPNQAPAFTSSDAVNVEENVTSVTTVTAEDPEGDAITFALEGADSSLFAIDTTTGELTFNNAPDFENPLDANADNVYEVQVEATDEFGATNTQGLSITVNDVNEAPDDAPEGSIAVFDDLVFGTANKDTLNAADQDNAYTGDNQIAFVGGGDDTIDGTGAAGNNRIYASSDKDLVLATEGDRVFTNSGDDEIFASTNNLIFAGNGNDRVDGSFGNGNNRLYSQGGDDDLFAGENDVLFGGEGNDRVLIAQGGDNLLTGGAGDDQFWIATSQQLPNSPNTITDFVSGEDVIGIGGFLELTFSDLTLTADNSNTIISFGADTPLAELQGVAPNSLTEADFAIVAQAPV